MKKTMILASVSMLGLLGGCAQKDWRDDCEAYYTSESGEYTKCVYQRKKRQRAMKAKMEKESAEKSTVQTNIIRSKPLNLPRVPKDYGRVPETTSRGDPVNED